jgi:hypothetical protein
LKNFLLISSLWVSFGFFGLLPAMAQATAPAFQLPASAIPSTPMAAGLPATKSPPTKLVRVYNGAGYFDDALAERLRPMLAKAFPPTVPEPAKAAAAGTNAAPSIPEVQKKLATGGL